MTVEAGCVLADVQAAASAHDRLFPLSLPPKAAATIGGNLRPTPAASRCCAMATRASCA